MTETDEQELSAEYRRNRMLAKGVALAAIAILVFGTVFYHYVEHFGWLDSAYFCTITLTTIGYGDLVPHTALGKLFTMFYAVAGIGIIGALANTMFKNAVIRRQLKRSKRGKPVNSLDI